jgi:hypothetical protein
MALKVLHLINPYAVKDANEHSLMQLTLQSIEEAISFSSSALEIQVLAITDEKEELELPASFIQRAVKLKTIGVVNTRLKELQYPLIQDLISEALKEPFDYLIFTNMDIILMPHFYRFVAGSIPVNDAIVINRRRIAKRQPLPSLAELQAELGWSHPGFDCFILKRSLLARFDFKEICVGIPFLESAFTHQIAAFASSPRFVLDAHLTLHIGLEVLPKVHKEAYWHNRNEFFKKINPALMSAYQLRSFPYANEGQLLRSLKWILNPSMFTRTYLQLEFKSRKQRWRQRIEQLRWYLLQR